MTSDLDEFSVLIVEDDEDARQNLVDILSLDGYFVQTESHCLPAIQAVERREFDAIIVDWRLPDGDGGELVPVIKREQPATPIVVITGMRDFETALTALRSGAYDFLLKPIFPDALRSVLGRIVERKQHLTDLEATQHKLVENERLAAIGQMVAGLAHESRNAFQRSHACLAELELDLQEMPESLQLIRKVQKALDDLHMLLEEVRNYSAPIILERRQFDMRALVSDTWQEILLAADAEKQDVEFSLSVDPRVPENCDFDRHRLTQVLRNLLENALYACAKPGKVSVEMAVSQTSDSHGKLVLHVRDNGNGIPAADRQKIFQPFYTTKTKGTGLGLAISERIVAAHGGTISAEENAPGAHFVVELPCQSSAHAHAAGQGSSPSSAHT